MCQTSLPRLSSSKRQQEISEKRRVGIRGVQLRSRIGQVHGRSQKPLRLRTRVSHGREGEGLHLPPVPEALNRACPEIQSPPETLPTLHRCPSTGRPHSASPSPT